MMMSHFTPTNYLKQIKKNISLATAALAIGMSYAHATPTYHKTIEVDKQTIFYREAGDKSDPTIVLLHGFPTSSHMYRNLIPKLADNYHVIAPDYPGFGNSSMPAVNEFEYSFDNLAKITEHFLNQVGVDKFTMYVMDYGAPIGFRIAQANPEKIEGLIIQNGNAYDEGLRDFWQPIRQYWADKSDANKQALADVLLTIDATKWQYTNGVRNSEMISPDNWLVDQAFLDRPGNKEIQLELFYSYGTNPALYPAWQKYFRTHQPPTLLVWGKGDYIFPEEGAHPYKRDLKNIDFNILDTGHFALEEDLDVISSKILSFMQQRVHRKGK
ncbi:alpha/beta fold hydrolase [Pseudoalteromonas sp. S16_S37]|uniref:alpha/beta fold hydrolase n=1 Tax=Pseudoalteromonas sp. S16_S37 TaxID=2720228 RepID=UPI001EEF37FB|nr:alpha/beta hydrolase [Pseudoalteromonas sp. S16_S37]